jgi:hypothetical protein
VQRDIAMANRDGHRRGDQFDVSLVDPDLMEEVRLLMELMVAASAVEERVDVGEIDRILGVRVPRQRRAAE